jgi:hypothetical protein
LHIGTKIAFITTVSYKEKDLPKKLICRQEIAINNASGHDRFGLEDQREA